MRTWMKKEIKAKGYILFYPIVLFYFILAAACGIDHGTRDGIVNVGETVPYSCVLMGTIQQRGKIDNLGERGELLKMLLIMSEEVRQERGLLSI